MSEEDNRPVVVGAAQFSQRDVDLATSLSPVKMMAKVARAAADDAGIGTTALSDVDALAVVDVMAWHPKNGPRLLAEALGAKPALELAAAVGGESPLVLCAELAERIRRGDSRIALVAGSNNVRTLRRARRAGVRLDWERGGEGEPTRIGENRPGNTERETHYGLALPTQVYPIFENAMRAHRGLDLETHRQRLGALCERFARVASENPHAWFPTARSAAEIATATETNRMIAYPYTKYMNAVMETEQGAAALLMSAGTARALGVDESKWVYWRGDGRAVEEAWFASERPSFAACPALRDSVDGALAAAGTTLEGVGHLDLYSCFPVAVEMACEMLGLAEDDPRGLTVTGWLPYAGGPGNNYTLHALASMVERLREHPGDCGLVTGNGWFFTKHSSCVLSTAAPNGKPAAVAEPRRDPLQRKPVRVFDEAQGNATVESYTVHYDRDGAPVRGVVIGRLEDGRRFLANTPEDSGLLERWVAAEVVGSEGRVLPLGGMNRFEPR
ncbi:MAG: acetyl-CoA acetyltransferase [Proteobacteria bacterium]|nr:acetyl-CoA acetyltransferase [Pseudomonadota bacterium]